MVLLGTSGNDIITGTTGPDVINGLAGADTSEGGTGNDVYYVDSTADVVIEASGAGNDYVYSTVSYTIPDNVERLYLSGTTPDLVATGGSNADYLIGSGVANKLVGLAGNDVLNPGAGADTSEGGVGNDVYSVDSTADVVIEASGAGNDYVYSTVSYTIPNNVERLYLSGTTPDLVATGGSNADFLIGTPLANKLVGLAGNDVLNPGAGADTSEGGVGNDVYKRSPVATPPTPPKHQPTYHNSKQNQTSILSTFHKQRSHPPSCLNPDTNSPTYDALPTNQPSTPIPADKPP